MKIVWECNVDCASQRMGIVKGQIGICLMRKVEQFSSSLQATVSSNMLAVDYEAHVIVASPYVTSITQA
jgi:hypothetical protein